jgi:hypothetical protein|eukprot:COSAG02_NODE_1435_length_12610_cov_7.021181_4_plen_80_part_00
MDWLNRFIVYFRMGKNKSAARFAQLAWRGLGQRAQPSWCFEVIVSPRAPEALNKLAHSCGSKSEHVNMGAKSWYWKSLP